MKAGLYTAALGAALLLAAHAQAHVTLEIQEASAGSFYKATLKVPHGCEGQPMVKMRVQLPDGVTNVKPQPKPGWKLATVKGRLGTPYDDGHGRMITEGIREVVWSNGRLPDDQYDEFAMQVRLPDAPNTTLHFLVVQECLKGVNRWIELPEAGKTSRDLKHPAPSLRLKPKS